MEASLCYRAGRRPACLFPKRKRKPKQEQTKSNQPNHGLNLTKVTALFFVLLKVHGKGVALSCSVLLSLWGEQVLRDTAF